MDVPLLTNGINLPRLNNLKPAVSVILVVGGTGKSRPDARVDVCVVLQESLHGSVVEVCSVVNGRSLGWGTTKDLGLPCVEVAVEVDDGDRSVGPIQTAEDGESDGMVASEGYDAGECLSGLGEAFLVGICEGPSHEDAVVAFFYLADGPFVVVS